MRKKIEHLATGWLIFMLMVSCEKQTTWDIQSGKTFMVADCIITNEMKYQTVKLYQSSDALNQTPQGITGAEISISAGDSVYDFAENPEESGSYRSVLPFRATAGKEYRLVISVGEHADTAWAAMVAITPMEAFHIVAYDSLFRFVYHSGSQPSMTEVYYDWSSVPGYCATYGACQASETFYTLDNIDIGKLFAPDRMIIPFPENTQIIRRKYSLSEDHQKFIRSLLLETQWRGGYFDTEQGNVPTGFRHGMRGWFAACMVIEDTAWFDGL